MRKFWYGLCFFFLIFNLNLLIDDYNLINYVIVEENDQLYDNHTNFMICMPFNEIRWHDKNERKLNATGNVPIRTILNYSIASLGGIKNATNPFKLDRSAVFAKHVCFLIDKLELEHSPPVTDLSQTHDYYLFVFSNGKQPHIFEYIYFNFRKLQRFIYMRIQKQKVYGREYLTNPACANPTNHFSSSRFNCLNRCLIERRFDDAFYGSNSRRSFDLGLIARQTNGTITEIIKSKNWTELNDCKACLKLTDCFYETYNAVRIRESYYEQIYSKEVKEKFDIKTAIYLAYYSTTDWWLQFFGLLTLFTNTSFVSLVSYSVHSTAKQLRIDQHIYFRLIFSKFKIYLVAFSLLFVLLQANSMIREHKFKANYPNKTSILKFTSEFEPFSMVICFPVELLMFESDELVKGRNSEIITNYTFDELKTQTDGKFAKKCPSIYYGFQSRPFNRTMSGNVLFKNLTFENEQYLSRCYLIEIQLEETRYEALMPTNSLFIRCTTKYWVVYLMDKGQRFTSNMNYFNGEFYLGKFNAKNSPSSKKSNCINYHKRKSLNCTTRRNCIDKCINEKYFESYSKLPLYSVIDGNDLDATALNSTFSSRRDTEIEFACMKRFERPNCDEIYFYETMKTSYLYKRDFLSINLNFEILIEKELEQQSMKLILNIFNLESIVLGSNATSLLLGIFSLLRKLFGLKWRRAYRYLIFVICSIGLVIHNILTFHGIINDSLIESSHFENIGNYRLPNPIFCFSYNKSLIDKNRKLTGHYLDTITRDNLNYGNVFDFITFLDKSHHHFVYLNQTGYSNKKFVLTHFYHLDDLKCFEIKLKIKFKLEDFYFTNTNNLLAVYLNKAFNTSSGYVYFLFRKSKRSKQFSNSFFFKINKNQTNKKHRSSKHLQPVYHHYIYKIIFEPFQIHTEDR